jgi:hypothetical protein
MEEKIRHLLEGTTCSYSRREKSKIEPKIKSGKVKENETTCSQGHTINNERGIVNKSGTIINKVFFDRKIIQIDIIE